MKKLCSECVRNLSAWLNQLKCENPYIDDYYYTVFTLKKETEMKERERVKEMSRTQRELQRQLSLRFEIVNDIDHIIFS